MAITVSSVWVLGIVLATLRTGAFAAASPILGKVMPTPARMAFAIAVALAVAKPVGHIPGIPGLAGAAVVNLGVGLFLGFISGLPFYAFGVAGNFLELGAGLSAAQVLDPTGNHNSGVLEGMFNMTALAILLLIGGDRLLVEGLAMSVHAVGFLGVAHVPGGLTAMAINSLGSMLLAGLTLAAPVMAAIFVADLALAALARFSPKSNAFMIGLPLKLLVTFLLLGAVVTIFPATVTQLTATITTNMSQVLHALAS